MLEKNSPLYQVNFNILSAKEMRDVLKSKAHCLRAGFPPNHIIITALNEFRNHYIDRVGMATYLSQMLGALGKVPMQDCTLYSEAGIQLDLPLNGAHNQPLQRFIAKSFAPAELPFKVEAIVSPGKVDERYL